VLEEANGQFEIGLKEYVRTCKETTLKSAGFEGLRQNRKNILLDVAKAAAVLCVVAGLVVAVLDGSFGVMGPLIASGAAFLSGTAAAGAELGILIGVGGLGVPLVGAAIGVPVLRFYAYQQLSVFQEYAEKHRPGVKAAKKAVKKQKR
jgi:hypothetical protein